MPSMIYKLFYIVAYSGQNILDHGVSYTCLILIEFLNIIVTHIQARLLIDLVKKTTGLNFITVSMSKKTDRRL